MEFFENIKQKLNYIKLELVENDFDFFLLKEFINSLKEDSEFMEASKYAGFNKTRLLKLIEPKKKSKKSIQKDILKQQFLDAVAKLHDPKKINKIINKYKNILTPEEKKILDEYEKRFNVSDTAKIHQKNGQYTPERLKLHDKIINKFLQGKTPQKKPTAIFLGGIGGSGKSTLLKSRGFDKNKFVILDSDEIKTMLPEFSKTRGVARAVFTHNESSDITDKIFDMALKKKLNIIVDGTLKNKENALKKIKLLKQKGYETIGLFTQLPTDKSIDRNSKRYINDDESRRRFVPNKIVANMGAKVNDSIHSLKRKFDKSYIYSTDTKFGAEPKLLQTYDKQKSKHKKFTKRSNHNLKQDKKYIKFINKKYRK